jgi:hypothetical protein
VISALHQIVNSWHINGHDFSAPRLLCSLFFFRQNKNVTRKFHYFASIVLLAPPIFLHDGETKKRPRAMLTLIRPIFHSSHSQTRLNFVLDKCLHSPAHSPKVETKIPPRGKRKVFVRCFLLRVTPMQLFFSLEFSFELFTPTGSDTRNLA